MNRLTYTFVLACVFLGCASVEEITKEEYKSVKESLTKDFRKAGYSGRLIYFWASVKQPGETRGRYSYLRIPLSTCFGCTLPRMALNCDRVEREAVNSARKVCNKKRISFRSFNRAHERYGRLGMTYTEELRELRALLHQLEPQVKREFIERDVPLDLDKDERGKYRFAEEDVRFHLDSTKLELAAWLAYDLGLGNAPILIEIDNKGRFLIDGEPGSIKEKVIPVVIKDEFQHIHIIPDPGLRCGRLFGFLDSLIAITGGQRIYFSTNLSWCLQFEMPSSDPVGGWGGLLESSRGMRISISHGDVVTVNDRVINVEPKDWSLLIGDALGERELKRVLLLVDNKASSGRLIQAALSARKAGAPVYLWRYTEEWEDIRYLK